MFGVKKWLLKNSTFYSKAAGFKIPLLQLTLRHKFRRSSYMEKFAVLKNFPYIFGNKRTVVPPVDDLTSSDEQMIISLNHMLDDERYKLREGFTFAYHALLAMIKDHDSRALGGIVEPTLRKDIDEELAEIVYENIGLKLENELDNHMKIDILDYSFHMGVDINREQNRNMRVKKYNIGGMFNSVQSKRTNMYLTEDLNMGKDIIINLEILVRFITDLKLNAFVQDEPDVSLIPTNEVKDKEVHFIRFETVMAKAQLTVWNYLKMRRYLDLDNLRNASWRITDIDNRLNGNPHVE